MNKRDLRTPDDAYLTVRTLRILKELNVPTMEIANAIDWDKLLETTVGSRPLIAVDFRITLTQHVINRVKKDLAEEPKYVERFEKGKGKEELDESGLCGYCKQPYVGEVCPGAWGDDWERCSSCGGM